MHFSLASDVVSLGWHEDGEYFGEVFYIVATDKRGNRVASPCIDRQWIESFRHHKQFIGNMIDRIMFMPCRWCPMQMFACGQLAIDAGFITEGNLALNEAEPRFDTSDWLPTYPAYGSLAYQEEEFYLVQRERQDELV